MRLLLALAALGAAAGIVVGVLGFGLSGRGAPAARSTGGSGPYRGSEPPPGIELPSFALRSYRGGVVRSSALRGRVVVVTFVDSACKESCPIIVGQIAQAMRRLSAEERRRVAALAISVDPRVDTPPRIRRFLRDRRALGALDYLSGGVRRMRPVWSAFHVLPAVETGDADVHSADVRVFDRKGAWVSTLHVGVDLTPASLAHDVRRASTGA